MKKILAFAAAVSMISGSAFATGAVSLNTYDSATPIYYLTSGTLATGSDVYAQVYYNGVAISNSDGVSTFSVSSGDFDAGYADVPGTTDGQTGVSLTLKVWKGGTSYETAEYTATVTWSQTLGSDKGAPNAPDPAALAIPSSVVLTAVSIPEPTTIALGMLGAAGLLIRRRRK
jgi:hypothetical protein